MSTQFLDLPGGRLAYDDTGGAGQLVVCAPGMGDVRAEYRFVAPVLAASGRRVVTMDLRGHGESSTGWAEHTPEAIGDDLLALVRHLEAGPGVLIGESMAAASAIWAAAQEPELVAGIVLTGPFARDVPQSALIRTLSKAVGSAVPLWTMFWASLFPTKKPADFASYRRALAANLREPGRLAALKAMLAASKARCAARADEVACPALVVMGTKDPDFKDQVAEAELVAGMVRGTVAMIEGAGHYPQVDHPDAYIAAVEKFLTTLPSGAA